MEISRKQFMMGVGGVGALTLALAACGSSTKSSSNSNGGKVDGTGKTLTVLFSAKPQYPDEQKAWFTKTAADFKALTGATVQWETFATANDEMTRIQTSVVSGTGPDVYGLGTTFTPTAYSTGAFVKLGADEWAKIGGKEKFTPATLGISGPDPENQIGIPFVSRPFVMAYNTELLKKAGIDKPATTWDEFAEHGKKLTSGDTYGLAIAYKDNFDPWKFIWGMSIQAGNRLIDGKNLHVDDPTVAKAYEAYFGWMTEQKAVDPAAVGWGNAQAVAAFASGKAAYLPMTSPLSIPTLDKSAVKGKYQFALMPMVPPGATSRPANGVAAATILSGDNLVVADYSPNKDLAFAFIKMITDTDAQDSYYKTFGEVPTNVEAAKALTSNPLVAPALDAASKAVATPFSGAWGDVQLALTNVAVQTIPDLSSGNVSAANIQSRIKDAQAKGQAALARAK